MSNIPWCHDHDEPLFGCPECKAEKINRQSSAEVSGQLTSHEKSKHQAMSEWREWEIQEAVTSILPEELRIAQRRYPGQVSAEPYWVPVIEYAAFSQLKSQLAEKDKRIEKLEAGLKFYADKNNWHGKMGVHKECDDLEQDNVGFSGLWGGKKAREALADSEGE